MFRPTLIFFLALFIVNTGFSQAEGEEMPTNTGGRPIIKEESRIYGKLLDEETGKPLEAASVQLSIPTNAGDSIIAGLFTKNNGDFSFGNLPDAESYTVLITALGYEPSTQTVSLEGNGPNGAAQKDMGNISLAKSIQSLDNVTVVAEKPALEMGIDRRIFNAEKSIVAKGGTAVDLLKNIPSLTVDLDGNVELRNSSPQIFIDGRPTILTLDQIPADNIEKVELITNPSAKFNASSAGGIINIVLKKDKRIGLNGLATVGIGTPGIYTGNLNLNLRQGKINFFASGGYNQSGGIARGSSFRESKDNGVITDYFNQESRNDRYRQFYSVRFGADYFIDNRNTLTLSQNIVRGTFRNNELQEQEYLDANKNLIRYGDRNADGNRNFKRNNTRLDYTHKFPEQGKELSANISYNYGGGTSNSDIVNTFYNPDGTLYNAPNVVRNNGSDNNDEWTAQLDFVNPMSENSKTEMGLRSYVNNYTSLFNAFSVANGGETKLPLSNNYAYREMVNAAYFTYTSKIGSIGYQAGLRAEYSKFDGELVDSAKSFGYEYPKQIKNLWNALFPSLFLTKEFGESQQLQLNYSRRIRRPRFWEMSPFVDINDPLNIRQGNPQLQPEFINSFELNYSYDFNRKGNLFTSIYWRNNPNDITQYSDTLTAEQYQQLNNAAVDPNAILNTFINAQTTNRYGAELIWQKKFTPNFDITPSIDVQYRKVTANVGSTDLSNEGVNWEAKLTINYKIVTDNSAFFDNMSFQLQGQYESPRVIPQGKRLARKDMDFAVRKDFLKDNRGTITFNINDVFNSQRWGTIYDTRDFYQESYGRWRVRGFRLSFSYKFGDAEFSLFKRGGGERDVDD